MAYNLRPRRIRDLLLEEPDIEAIGEKASDDEVDHVSEEECSDSEISSKSNDSETDMEVEDATANARTLESRARGRPASTLKGKKWLRVENKSAGEKVRSY